MFIKNRTKNLLIGVVIISILIMVSMIIISILIRGKKSFLNEAEVRVIKMLLALYIIAAIVAFTAFIAFNLYENVWSFFDKDKDLKKIMKKEFTINELEEILFTKDKIKALEKFSYNLPEILKALETKEKIQVFFEQLDDEKKVKALEEF